MQGVVRVRCEGSSLSASVLEQYLHRVLHSLLVCSALAGCGPTDDLNGVQHERAALEFGTVSYDNGDSNQCVINGLSIHCCPGNHAGDSRWVMIGVHVDNNLFKCAKLAPETYAPVFIDGPDGNVFTQREGMHACPVNSVMVGFHFDANDLVCMPLPRTMIETVDDVPTQDGYPMHVCPDGHAMSGIHYDQNRFLCAE